VGEKIAIKIKKVDNRIQYWSNGELKQEVVMPTTSEVADASKKGITLTPLIITYEKIE